ncbi:hypothetical protein ACFQZC_21445 [Streptacidiphilus monticola]
MTEIRAARTVDEIVAAEHLFDGPVKPEGWAAFSSRTATTCCWPTRTGNPTRTVP